MQVGQQLEDDLKDDAVINAVRLAAQRDPEWLVSVASSDRSTATAIAESIFAAAVRQCDLQIISQLLKTPLVFPDGIILGQIPEVRYSLRRGSSRILVSFIPETFFCTPLQKAASLGNAPLMKALIQAGARVNHDGNRLDLSPLELACSVKSISLAMYSVNILLEHGAIINRPATTTRPTALMLAVLAHNWKLVEFLIAHGADTERIYHSESAGLDLTACRLAVLCGDLRVLEALTASEKCRKTLCEDHDLMVLAISAGEDCIVTYLRDAGASPNVECSWGEHPLTTAIFVGDLDGYPLPADDIRGIEIKAPYTRPTPMHAAAFKGDVDAILCLESYGFSLTPSIEYGTTKDVRMYCTYSECATGLCDEVRTPLQVALYRKHAQAAMTLLLLGAYKFHGGEVALAAALGSIELVNMLLDLGESVDECWLGTSPVQAALEHGHGRIACELIGKGASLVGGEWTRAIMCGDNDLISLIWSRSTPEQRQAPGPRSETPLEAAYATGNLKAIDAILRQPWARYDSAALCAGVWYAKEHYTDRHYRQYGDVLKLLLKRRDPSSEMDTLEATALVVAVKYRYFYQELLYILLQYLKPSLARSLHVPTLRTTSNFWWRSENRHGMSPLHIAVDENCLWAVNVLLERGFRPDEECFLKILQCPTTGDAGRIATAVWEAMHLSSHDETWTARSFEAILKTRQPQLVHRLLELGLQVNSRKCYKSGWTALQLAALYSDNRIVQELIKAGADVNAPAAPEAGATALQVAAIFNKMDIVRTLLEHGADVNAPGASNHGRTALEGAAEYGRLDMVQLLLNKGARTEGDDRLQYIRAVKFAEQRGHYAVAELLQQHRDWTNEDVELMNARNLI